MAGLVPFNHRNGLSARNTGRGDLFGMLDDFFNDSWLPRRSLMSDTFKLDVREEEKGYVVEAEVPGAKREEITLSLENSCLTLGVNRSEENTQKQKNYLHQERRITSMQRSIYLPDAQEEGTTAKLEEGILTIHVPKAEKDQQQRRIAIE